MLRLFLRGVGLLILIFLFAPLGFSKNPAENEDKDVAAKAGDVTAPSSASSPDAATASDTANSAETGPSDATTTAAPVPSSQNASTAKKSPKNAASEPAPIFTPLLATTGTLGMFTLETGDTLPKGGFAFSGFGDKFGRMPGSVTIFEIGADLSYGITDRLNVYATFDPYGHVHVGCPGQLSLRSIPLSSTCAPLATGTSIPNSFFPVVSGSAPGYVEDYPFAANNNGGVGDITLGLKYALLSQRLGNPVSLSVRNDLIIATKTDEEKLLNDGTQASPLSDMVSLALSKQWGNILTGTFNFGYMFVRAPRSDGQILFAMPDQVRTGVGFQLFPNRRFEPMMEYSGVIFSNAPSTPEDMSFGARDPVDGVWGLRMYPVEGYRDRRRLPLHAQSEEFGRPVRICRQDRDGLLAREGPAGEPSAHGFLHGRQGHGVFRLERYR